MELLGNESLKKSLFGKIRDGRFCSFYIIEGPEGSGKLTAARLAAASICCHERKPDGMPCGECNSCKKILETGHVDVSELYPQPDKKFIGVGLVRKMLEEAALVPSEADSRIFIIPNGELLNVNAQNALLKNLEEPNPSIVFIILTNDITALLPTVRSRGFLLRTEPLPDSLVTSELKKRYPALGLAETERLVRFASGSLGKALEFAEKGRSFNEYEQVVSYFTAIADGKHHAALCEILPPSGTKRAQMSILLGLMKEALRDILLFLTGGGSEPIFFEDRVLLRRAAYALESERASEMFDKVTELSGLIEMNINPVSVISELNILFS